LTKEALVRGAARTPLGEAIGDRLVPAEVTFTGMMMRELAIPG
jgi:hypothetical protein